MKLLEYIHTPTVLNNKNIFTLRKYENLIHHFTNNDSDFIYLHYSQDFLENGDAIDFFRNIQNKVVLISSPDIDFPPPKKPIAMINMRIFPNFLPIIWISNISIKFIPNYYPLLNKII